MRILATLCRLFASLFCSVLYIWWVYEFLYVYTYARMYVYMCVSVLLNVYNFWHIRTFRWRINVEEGDKYLYVYKDDIMLNGRFMMQ